MKRLIIAEKPSVATDISRALGKFTRKGEYYENDDTIITSAVGHIVELQMPEDYDKKLGFWRMESLPIIPEEFKLKPIEKTKKKFAEIKKLLARKDVGEVINACDAGREGELIFHYLYRLAGGKKPVRRLWMSSMTREGIREAFQRLRDGEDMAPLADAARCRSEADWLIGINCTRGVTKRLFGGRAGNVAGVGRVQTPTLAIVMERELQIRKFEPRTYWRITGNFEITQGAYSGMYQKPGYKKGADEHDRSDRLWEREQAEAVLAALQGSPTAAVSEEKKKATQLSPRLYDLTTLQREANNRFGYSARRTLQLAQSLYERHKVITYPRTDARVLPEDYPATCRRVMESLRDDLQPLARKALDAGWIRPNKRIFNNAGVSDHFAIIPTEQSPKSLSAEESKIFDMIARRFLAVFYPAAEFDVTTRLSVVAEHTFRTEGKVLVAPGWLEVYGRSTLDERDTILPPLTEADGSPPTARTLGGDLEETQTRPPPRYTEATLLSAMEGAGKLVDDEELADAMKEKGLGTPATRAQIIERLVAEKYLERDRRDLVPTVKAESLLEFLSAINAEVLTSPALTGEWEYKLHQIENRRLKGDAFMKEIADATRSIIGRIKQYEEKGEDPQPTGLTLETNGEPLLETLRTFRTPSDSAVVYKVIGNRKMEPAEAKELVEKGRIGPLDGFVSKNGKPYSASLVLGDEGKVKFDFGGPSAAAAEENPEELDKLEPVGRCPKTGGDLFETANSFLVRVKENGSASIPFKLSRKILEQEIPREQVLKLLETGKTDVLPSFRSKRTKRQFAASLVLKPGNKIGFEFPPREPGKGKGRKPAAKAKTTAKADSE